MSTLPITTDDRLIWDTWLAMYRLPVVTVADEVGTFTALAGQALTTDELAARISAVPRALAIHLGLLAALGFVERHEGRWRATAAARTWMHPEAEGYAGPLLHRMRQAQPLHAQLLSTLRPQVRAEAHQSAAAEWERGEMPPELARSITAFMNAHSLAAAKAVGAQTLFADAQSLLDVGGGSAIFSIEIAKLQPSLRATVMEIKAVCAEADRYIGAAELASRVRTQSVNMFTQPWPTGHDVHFLSNILHDWSDDTCRMLLKKSFEALPAGGRIVLHEMLMNDDGCGPLPCAAFSLLMLLGTRGRQYSLPELRGFLEPVGFTGVDAFSTGGGYYSLVVARKP
ncbi:MAG TPA: methyltransferase [Steroidobacteraceae bacterium]|nr:methyltransferase [Steroidobacteraceae bacterium]